MKLKNKLMLSFVLITATGSCFAIFENIKLRSAAFDGDKNRVEQLLNQGADVNSASVMGNSPLMWAADRGHFEIVALLLDRGADVFKTDILGQTALSMARYWLGKSSDAQTKERYQKTVALLEKAEKKQHRKK